MLEFYHTEFERAAAFAGLNRRPAAAGRIGDHGFSLGRAGEKTVTVRSSAKIGN